MMRTRRRGIYLGEFTEHQLIVIWRNAASGVAHFDPHLVGVRPASRKCNPYATAFTRELDCIANKIGEHMFDLVAIGEYRRQVVAVEALDGEMLLGGQRFVEHPDLIRELR